MDICAISTSSFYCQTIKRKKRLIKPKPKRKFTAANPCVSPALDSDFNAETGEWERPETITDIQAEFVDENPTTASTEVRSSRSPMTWRYRTLLSLHKLKTFSDRRDNHIMTMKMIPSVRKFAVSSAHVRLRILKRMKSALKLKRKLDVVGQVKCRFRKRLRKIIETRNVSQFVLLFFKYPFPSYYHHCRSKLTFFFETRLFAYYTIFFHYVMELKHIFKPIFHNEEFKFSNLPWTQLHQIGPHCNKKKPNIDKNILKSLKAFVTSTKSLQLVKFYMKDISNYRVLERTLKIILTHTTYPVTIGPALLKTIRLIKRWEKTFQCLEPR